jgi:SAM-dependent methyltransferase
MGAGRLVPQKGVVTLSMSLSATGGDRAAAVCPLCLSPASPWPAPRAASLCRCRNRVCSLTFVHPQPSDEALAAAYDGFYYPRGPAESDVVFSPTPMAVAERVALAVSERFGITWSLATVLDFGCGDGRVVTVFTKRGAAVWGLEPNPRAREQAAGVLGGRVYRSLEHLRSQGGGIRFDFVFMEQVIEHLRDPVRTLSELRMSVNRSAVLYVGTPNAGGANAAFLGSRWREMQNPTHLWFFNWRSLVRALGAAGWREPTRLIGGFRYPTAGVLRGAVQRALGWAGLEGALRVTARPSEEPFVP